jgi:hypothetical protein
MVISVWVEPGEHHGVRARITATRDLAEFGDSYTWVVGDVDAACAGLRKWLYAVTGTPGLDDR